MVVRCQNPGMWLLTNLYVGKLTEAFFTEFTKAVWCKPRPSINTETAAKGQRKRGRPTFFACIFQMLRPNLIIFGTHKRQKFNNTLYEMNSNNVLLHDQKKLQIYQSCYIQVRNIDADISTNVRNVLLSCSISYLRSDKSPLTSLRCGQQTVQT